MLTTTTLALALASGLSQATESGDRYERFMVEAALGGGPETQSPFTDRLDDFGFDRSLNLFGGMVMLAGSAVYSPLRGLAVVFTVGNIDSDSYHRALLQLGDEDFDEYYRWTTWRAGAYGRYGLPVAEGWLVPYVQGGGGPAMALATYTDERCEQQRRFMGWHLAGAAGLQLMPSVAGHRHLGIYAQVETSYAPVLDNLMGDVHDSGRRAIMLGIRAGY